MIKQFRVALLALLSFSFGLAQDPASTVDKERIRFGGAIEPPPITALDVAKMRVVVAAEISPDGKSVAVLTSVPRTTSEPNGRAHSELSVVPFEGGQQRVLIPAPGTITGVQWSGDSQAIFFLSKRGDDKEARVWRIPAAGGKPEAVTPAGRAVKTFSATADGKRVAFTEEEPEDLRRAARKMAGFNQEIYEEEWRRVVVRELELEGGKIKTYEVPGSAFEVAYNANGAKLCVTAAPTPSVDDSYMRKDVYVVDVASGAAVKAIDPPGKMGNAVVSPDGTQVAAVIGIDEHDTHESTLVVADATKAGPYRVLTEKDFEGHVTLCAWIGGGPVGPLICTLTQQGVESRLEATPPTQVGAAMIDPNVTGAVTRFSVSGGRFAYVASRPDHPPEAFALDISPMEEASTPASRRLTDSNPWLKERHLAQQEVVTWKASLDGREIQGMLIHPLATPDKPAPMIAVIHGGPEANDMNGWLTSYSNPGQVAAAKGYYVLYPNYRSSTGRGVAFAKLGQGDLANGEFTDILDGIDALVAKGLVDKAKVGITGGSYGGYLSAWAATKWTDRFAAAVVFVGVTDQVSKRLCTDIPMEDYLVHWKIWTDENVALVWDRSPIAHAKGSKTPTLICHGKDDPRVNPAQSLELYRTLKTRGTAPVRLVWYPGEGHGNQNRCSRFDYSLRQMAWFDHFLMNGGKDLPPGEVEYNEAPVAPAAGK